MTNAEKYLKDEANDNEFVNNFVKYRISHKGIFSASTLFEFLQAEVKPTLTEDERVILRNLQNVRYIGRTEGTGYLYATFNTIDNYSNRSDVTDINLYFSKMFPFIKNGEEYEIAKLLKGE